MNSQAPGMGCCRLVAYGNAPGVLEEILSWQQISRVLINSKSLIFLLIVFSSGPAAGHR